MIDKTSVAADALRAVAHGSRIMIGGFGAPGTPFTLIAALLAQGAEELTLVKNDANEQGMGISTLFEAGRTRKFIVSHMGLNAVAIEMMNQGQMEVEMHPQGILAEKIRAGGAGLAAFLTDIGLETLLAEKRETAVFRGNRYIVEPALRADVALIHAAKADQYGNLVYAKSARNFNPLMATAADLVVAEAREIVDTGALDPDHIHTPGAFVDHVVAVDTTMKEYEVLPNHVL